MKQDLIKDVIQGMLPYLNNAQNEKLQTVLQYSLAKYEVIENQHQDKSGAELCRAVFIGKTDRGLF